MARLMPLRSGKVGGLRLRLGVPRPHPQGVGVGPGTKAHVPAQRLPSLPPLPVPARYGVVLGAVIGGVLGAVLLVLLLVYLTRYCWMRRQAALQRRLR